MNDFLAMLSSSVGRAHYGFNHVKSAADSDAVETLLMSDSVFRIRDFVARRKYVDLVEQVSQSCATPPSGWQTLSVADAWQRAQSCNARLVVTSHPPCVLPVVQVQSKGGKFFCLSSLHVTGEQLHQLGGVAAILRFPLEIDTAEEENHDLVRHQLMIMC